MGFGDDLMGTGVARVVILEARNTYPEAKAVFGDPDTYFNPETNELKVHFSEVFWNNPYILQPDEECRQLVCIPDYPGNRGYINYDACAKSGDRILNYKFHGGYCAPKGDLYFSPYEKVDVMSAILRQEFSEGFFVVEPNVKAEVSADNKSWPMERWHELAKEVAPLTLVQLGLDESSWTLADAGVKFLPTPTFRQACGVLSTSMGFIGTDGGLHHAAAALDIPAVVLWSHYSPPAILGYQSHINLRDPSLSLVDSCGTVGSSCIRCRMSMEAITVEMVVEAIEEMINVSYQDRSPTGRHLTARLVGETSEGKEGGVSEIVGTV